MFCFLFFNEILQNHFSLQTKICRHQQHRGKVSGTPLRGLGNPALMVFSTTH